MRRIGLAVITCGLLAGTPALAGKISSAYTDFNLAKCQQTFSDDEAASGIWTCKGIKGFSVWYAEGDLRGFVAFGTLAPAQCSSTQTFGSFNSPGGKIEWRLDDGKPFATILRWRTDNGEGVRRQWLVVTKLDGKKTCRTALVDATLPDANLMARQRADSTRTFNCETGMPEVVSTPALDVTEIMSGVPCGPGPFREE